MNYWLSVTARVWLQQAERTSDSARPLYSLALLARVSTCRGNGGQTDETIHTTSIDYQHIFTFALNANYNNSPEKKSFQLEPFHHTQTSNSFNIIHSPAAQYKQPHFQHAST